MKKLLLLTTLLFVALSVGAQTKVYDNLKTTYECTYLFNKIDISPTQTVADITLQNYPNYWIMLNSGAYLQDNNGHKYKLLKCDGFTLDKKVFMPLSGRMDAKLYFEPIPHDVTSLDFIGSAEKSSNTYGISLIKQPTALPSSFYGNWITTDGTSKWMYGIMDNVVIMDNSVWNYSSIKKRSNTYEITVIRGDKQEKLYLKSSKNDHMMISRSGNKSFVDYARQFTVNNAVASEWIFSPEKYRNTIYKKGTSVIRGYIDSYTPKLGFTSCTLSFNDYITNKNANFVFEISPNGEFEAKIELEHPINLLSMELRTNIFVIPGDTIFVYTNLKEVFHPKNRLSRENNSLIFMSSNESAEVNNILPIVNKAFNFELIEDYKIQQAAIKKGMKGVMNYNEILVNNIRNILDSTAIILSKHTISDFAKDVIITDLLTNKFTDILDLYVNHDRTRNHYWQDSIGKTNMKPNKDFETLPKSYFDFLPLISQTVIDNPLIITSSATWTPFNRFEFSPLANKIIVKNMANLEEVYNAEYDKLKSYGLGESFLYDCTLSREIAGLLNHPNKYLLLQNVSKALTYIKTPYVAGKIVEMYANAVRPVVAQNKSNSKADVIFAKLIEPYKGNVLVIDFWSTGCGPCRSGMISSKGTVEKYKNHKIKFLYVTDETQTPLEAATKFLTENNIKGEQIRLTADEWNYLSAKFNISSIPRILLVDKNGIVVDDNYHMYDFTIVEELEKGE